MLDPTAQGNQLVSEAQEYRSAEEFQPFLSERDDAGYLYKIVSNNVIVKFPVVLRAGIDLDKDEVKFGFVLEVTSQAGLASSNKITVPIQINTGVMKLNKTGGNLKSDASAVSLKKKD